MRKSDAIAYFDGNVSALARALKIDQSTPYSWGEYPPREHQLELEIITHGMLKAEAKEIKSKRLGSKRAKV